MTSVCIFGRSKTVYVHVEEFEEVIIDIKSAPKGWAKFLSLSMLNEI